MYQIGDYAVYRLFSVCRIEGIDSPTFDSEKKYYKLLPALPCSNPTTIYVPVTDEEGLRPLFTETDAKLALQSLPTISPSRCVAKKPSQQGAYYQELLSSKDVRVYLSIIKELTLKQKANTKRLNEIEMRFLHKLESLLGEELSIVFATTPEAIKSQIREGIFGK